MGCREFVYDLFRLDPVLNTLGINTDTLYPNFAPDSPGAGVDQFMVLRWGVEGARFGRDTTVRPWDLTVWAYYMQPDFAGIDRMLNRVKVLLRQAEAKAHENGWINSIVDNGGSEDLPATEYGNSAVTRNWGFTIYASEEGT